MKKVGFVGCAHIHTPQFVRELLKREDIQVVAAWDHMKDRAEALAVQFGAKVVGDPAEIYSDASIDGVIICAETNRHLELTIQAAEAKKAVYVEKPLGMGAEDCWKMAAAIEKAGVLFQTGYFMRGWGIHRFLKQQIEAGAFGKVTRFRHMNNHHGSLAGWFDKEWRWMADPVQAGVGGFGDLGFHSLDIMLWMMGEPEEVTAVTKVVTGRYGESCDETGEALLKFKNGAIGSIAAGWVDVQQPVQLLITGTEGHAAVVNGQLFFKSNKVEGADGTTPWTAIPDNDPHAFTKFLNALVGEKADLISASEAALDSAVMEAMYKASRNQTWEKPVLG